MKKTYEEKKHKDRASPEDQKVITYHSIFRPGKNVGSKTLPRTEAEINQDVLAAREEERQDAKNHEEIVNSTLGGFVK